MAYHPEDRDWDTEMEDLEKRFGPEPTRRFPSLEPAYKDPFADLSKGKIAEFPKSSGGKKDWKDDWKGTKTSCYHSHPPYEVAPGMTIYGGSCHWPAVKDAAVYGGFDGGMHFQHGGYPWDPKSGDGVVEFLFKITDMQAPLDKTGFRRMVEWLGEQLKAGKKVHLGCIGGHGRTGMVLAALRKHLTGDENAIAHVRQHYCKKAVESSVQMKFLKEEWGIASLEPTKTSSYGSSSSKYSSTKGVTDFMSHRGYGKSTGKPMHAESSIWGGPIA